MAQKWLKQLQASNAENAINAQSEYNDIDADGDGKLTAKELAQVCNITVLEAEELIEQYDANGDGALDENEFEDLKQQILQQQQLNMTNKININDNYDQFDKDGDGRLDANEFAQACGITVQEAQNIIYQYDANGDGTLDQNEFEDLKQQILSQQRDIISDQILHNQQYNDIDVNNDGKLSAAELAIACDITELDAQNIILQYDADGDGTLDKNEFENLKQQILSQQRDIISDQILHNQQYNDIDVNNDGKLSAAELAIACDITELDAQNIILQYDADGDGMLDKNEFEDLKQQILSQKEDIQEYQQDNNPFDEPVEQKQEEYVTPSGISINADVAAYQSAVYDNNTPQMVINNSNGRDNSNSTFVGYNQQNNAPQYSGNIDNVDQSDYNVNNSNAKGFGVDIFANENNNKSVYNNTNSTNNTNVNDSPFGKKGIEYNNQSNVNAKPFGTKTNNSYGKQNDSPFGKKQNLFGTKPADGYNNEPKAIILKNNNKPKYKHQWVLGIKYDVQKEEIILNVSDDTTGKKWRKIVTKHDYYGDMKQEYFRLGKIINNGNAKYTYPPNDIGAVQAELSKGDDKYNFYAQPV
eukprot:125679_1